MLIGKPRYMQRRNESSKTSICPILCACQWRVGFWKTIVTSEANVLCAGMHEAGKRCTELLEKTANALQRFAKRLAVLKFRAFDTNNVK